MDSRWLHPKKPGSTPQTAEQQESEAETRWELARKILADELTPEDLPSETSAYTRFMIEDTSRKLDRVGRNPQ